MVDRQLIGDVALAILIALPTAAHPQPLIHEDRAAVVPLAQTASVAERVP